MKADQEAFLSCTTRIGFNLTLSRTMMEWTRGAQSSA